LLKTTSEDNDSVAKMLGEFLREAAVLLVIFVPLEWLRRDERHGLLWWLGAMLLSISLLVAGIWIERARE